MAQELSLGLEVLPEFGKIRVHGGKHGVQGLPAHVAVFQNHVQRGCIAPELGHGDGFQLQRVQGEGHGVFDGVVAGKLCLVGVLPDGRIVGIGQIPDGGEIGGLSPVVHGHGAGEVLVHIRPGVALGELGHHLFANAGQLMDLVLLNPLQQVGIVLQDRVLFRQRIQVLQRADPFFDGGQRGGRGRIQGDDSAHGGHGGAVSRVCGLLQAGIAGQLVHKLYQLLLQVQSLQQGSLMVLPGQLFCKGFQGLYGFVQLLQVGRKLRGLQACIDRGQIPAFIHNSIPPVFCAAHGGQRFLPDRIHHFRPGCNLFFPKPSPTGKGDRRTARRESFWGTKSPGVRMASRGERGQNLMRAARRRPYRPGIS